MSLSVRLVAPARLGTLLLGLFAASAASSGAGCSSSAAAPNYDSGVGGPVTGALDDHCQGKPPVVVDEATCEGNADGGLSEPADAAATGDDGGAPEEELPTQYNSEGDDDDCKYHVKFVITAARQGQSATIRMTLTRLANGAPATGASPTLEGYLASNDTHVLPNVAGQPVESPVGSGVYTIPLKFDQAGRWVIRFHLYEDCLDSETSPHGHIAFFVDVAAP